MKKFSNKILIIVLVVLVGAFALSKIFRSPKLESNLKKELVNVDTAQVTEVRIDPAKEGTAEVRLLRKGNRWIVTSEGKEAEAGAGMVQSMLGVLMDLQSQRMVTRKKERWDNFQVGDRGTRVVVYRDADKLADLRIGKAGFNEGNPGMGGGAGSAFTYIRLTDEDEVYSSDGFIATHFNRSFNEWRNQLFLKVNKDEVIRIKFNYPDSSYTLEKKDSVWAVNNLPVIETKVNQYFSKIRFKNISEFEDQYVIPGPAPFRLQIFGAAGSIATTQAWPKSEEELILSSTLQEGVYFRGKKSEIQRDIFVGKSWFTEP